MDLASASPAEIAAIRRRYFWMVTSIGFIDIGIDLIFILTMGAWAYAVRSLIIGVTLMFAVNFLLARRLFGPIQRFLQGEATFEETQRRLTQLPLLSAQHVALLAFVLTAVRVSSGYFLPASSMVGVPIPTIADAIVVSIVVPVFYFTYTYFVVSDYLASLCTFIFHHYGRNLELFFGNYTVKLIVALLVISIAPLAAVMVDLFSYHGERLQMEISNDVGVALLGVVISGYFIGRSLLRPMRNLSAAMRTVAGGDLTVRVPVTSNDEVGEVTGRFNNMVEGLRERERIRETFGRYVDESVAAAILRNQGDGALMGETREATVLFTDIEGFTGIAEWLPAHQLVAALNEYLETVLAPIRAHGGVVNTFIGDGLFASFNMPLLCEGHAAAAVRAAIDIQRAVSNRTFGDSGVAFPTRIGISTGTVIGGSVGAGRRMSFSLLGDTVNLAARLEKLNKVQGTAILVSDSTQAGCGDGFAFTSLGPVTVRGRHEPVAVYSVDYKMQGSRQ